MRVLRGLVVTAVICGLTLTGNVFVAQAADGTLSGMVTSGGAALGDVEVTAYQPCPPGPLPPPGSDPWGCAIPVASTVTAADGAYSLVLADGTYRIGFEDPSGAHQTEFFDGAGRLGVADDLTISGGHMGGVDAEMVSLHQLSGAVTVDGVPMPSVAVTAWQLASDQPDAGWTSVKWTLTAPDGRYVLHLPDGIFRVEFATWQARFQPAFYDGASTLDVGTDIIIAGDAVSGIDAAIVSDDAEAGPAIAGTVTADGAASVEGVAVTAWWRSDALAPWMSVKETVTSSDGTYLLRVPEGVYRVGFSDQSGTWRDVFYDGFAAIADARDVAVTGSGADGIDVDLAPADDEPGPSDDSWSSPILLSSAGADGWYPSVAAGADGTAIAAWSEFDGSEKQLLVSSREPHGSWSDPEPLSQAGDDASEPYVAVGRRGRAVAVWRQLSPSGYRVLAATRDGRGSWSAPEPLSNTGGDASDATVTVGTNGRAVAVWHEQRGTGHRVMASSRTGSGPWSPPQVLSELATDARSPQVGVGPDGSTVVVWSQSDGVHHRVHVSHRTGNGPWSAPSVLSDPDADAWDPQIALGSRHRAAVVWETSDGWNDVVQTATREGRGSWSGPQSLSEPGGDGFDPRISVDSDGMVTAVWTWRVNGDSQVVGASLGPGGDWSSPVAVSSPDRDARSPDIAAGPDRTATAVWVQTNGRNEWVEVATRDRDGVWSAPSRVGEVAVRVFGPHVAAGPSGSVAAVWETRVDTHDRVQATVRSPETISPGGGDG